LFFSAPTPLRGKLQITNPKLQSKRCPSGLLLTPPAIKREARKMGRWGKKRSDRNGEIGGLGEKT